MYLKLKVLRESRYWTASGTAYGDTTNAMFKIIKPRSPNPNTQSTWALGWKDLDSLGGRDIPREGLDLKIYHLEDPVGSAEHSRMIEHLKNQEIKKEIEVKTGINKSVWTTKQFKFYKDSFVKLAMSAKVPLINSTEGGILMELSCIPLKNSLVRYCKDPIQKKDIWNTSSQKRKRKKRR